MKIPFLASLLGLVCITVGCDSSVPPYSGDGELVNTSSHEAWVRVPSLTIRLCSFDMRTNFQRTFALGDIAFYRKTTVEPELVFFDDKGEIWRRGSALSPSERNQLKWKDIDPVTMEWSGVLYSQTRGELLRFHPKACDMLWSRSSFVASNMVVLHPGGETKVQAGEKLSLEVNYLGDPSLSKTASLVLVCRPE